MRSVPYLSCIVSIYYSLQVSHCVNGEIESITSEQLNEGIRNQLYAAVIDVRSQTDWDLGHIPNATLIASLNTMDLPPIPQVITAVSCNAEDQKIVVTCRTGARAAVAAEKLFAAGYKATIYNGGGTDDWTAAGFELVQTESLKSCTGTDTTGTDTSGIFPRFDSSLTSYLLMLASNVWLLGVLIV